MLVYLNFPSSSLQVYCAAVHITANAAADGVLIDTRTQQK